MRTFSRREFLIAGGATALGLIAAACGKNGNGGGGGFFQGTPGSLGELVEGREQTLQVLNSNFETFPNKTQRLVFGLRNPSTGDFHQGGRARVWAGLERESPPLGPFEAAFHGEGLGDRGVYVAEGIFPSEGTWTLVVEAKPDGVPETLIGPAQQQVGRQTTMPAAGDAAVSVATPTLDEQRGVDPICTLPDGPCAMHTISLDDALANGSPTVMIIATPAFCQSALCGPEVEILSDLSGDYGGRIDFVHIELLANDDDQTVQTFSPLSPGAQAWRVEQEPAIYFMDAAGTITQRIIGPFDRMEARETVEQLLA
ncbi:MAG TPA: hypothetical protein VGB52_08785 [Actinomycetota bacterium]